jgi:hypothetical protein
MSRGGKRPGAGRPPGVRNKRSVVLAERLAEAGLDPADRLAALAVKAEREGQCDLAVRCWSELLPFVHAKLRQREPIGQSGIEQMVRASYMIVTGVPRAPDEHVVGDRAFTQTGVYQSRVPEDASTEEREPD